MSAAIASVSFVTPIVTLHVGKKQARITQMVNKDTAKLSLSTPLAAFKGKHYEKEWEDARGRKSMIRATIIDVLEVADENTNELDEPRLVARYPDRVKETLHKAIVLDLMETDEVELTLCDAFNDFTSITSARFLLTCAFLEDARGVTSALSLLVHSHLLPCDVNAKHAAVQSELHKLQEAPGAAEKEIRNNYSSITETYKGLAVPNWAADDTAFKRDKKKYLEVLMRLLAEKIPLKGGVHGWISVILGRQDWPMNTPARDADDEEHANDPHPMDNYGDHQIETLCRHYKEFMRRK